MATPTIRVRPGVLNRLREIHQLPSDDALARRIGVSRATLDRVRREEQPPSAQFIAGAAVFSKLGVEELVEVVK